LRKVSFGVGTSEGREAQAVRFRTFDLYASPAEGTLLVAPVRARFIALFENGFE
jgi:hypothetical protein